MTENDVRRRLLAQYGRCICEAGYCTGELNREDVPEGKFCDACCHMDIYWPCFHDPESPWPATEDVYVV